jgi:hypothetical protein
MLWLSDLLIQHPDLESFEDLARLVENAASGGEMFLRMDVRPPFKDTPEDWEDRLEAVFSSAPR